MTQHSSKKEDKWRWLTLASTGIAIFLGVMHVTGLPSCDEYVTKAQAAERNARVTARIEKIEVLIERNAEAIQDLTLNQARAQERLKSIEKASDK